MKQYGITMVSLEDLLAKSDFVSLHSPMTPATKHMINDKSIATMKDGAVVINTARGPLIDEAALMCFEVGQAASCRPGRVRSGTAASEQSVDFDAKCFAQRPRCRHGQRIARGHVGFG